MKSKIVLIDDMRNGKSSIGNLFLGKERFKVCDDISPCLDYFVNSYDTGDLIIFNTVGLNDKTDVSNLQKMKQMIKDICKSFMGKYIWKQIGIIFTRYGYDEEQHEEIKMKAKNM